MSAAVPAPPPECLAAAPRRTWLLLGRKPGDNGQLLALAETLGWPFETKRLAYRPWELVTNRLLPSSLLGIDRAASSPLEAPWPELILTAGRRNEPVARWIRDQAGGRRQLKLVQVGRPWAPPQAFDLVVSTPQYALAPGPNVLINEAPMHRITAARLAEAATRIEPPLGDDLPRPWTAVMLGGHVGPHTFTPRVARRLAAELATLVDATGGSLLLSTSARTPAAVVDAVEAGLRAPHRLYRWRPADPGNPYFGFLAVADLVVVTSDSMSMLVEAVATGKPVLIFDLAKARDAARPTRRSLLFHLGRWLGPSQLRRDVGEIHRRQVAAGRAAWLGQPWPGSSRTPPLDDAERAAARVRALFHGVRCPSQPPAGHTEC